MKWEYVGHQDNAIRECVGATIAGVLTEDECRELFVGGSWADAGWKLTDGRIVVAIEMTPDTEGYSGPALYYVGTPSGVGQQGEGIA